VWNMEGSGDGVCANSHSATCTFVANGNLVAMPRFLNSGFTVTVSVTGNGRVVNTAGVNGSIYCSTTDTICAATAGVGTPVQLKAIPATGYIVNWGGACAGSSLTCNFTSSGDKSVTANFVVNNNVPPSAPTTLTSAISNGAVNLTWTDTSINETSFIVQRRSGTGSYTNVATLSAGVTTYVDSNTSTSLTYTYRVYASNTYGNSGYTNESSVTTPAPTPDLVVTSIKLAKMTDGSYTATIIVANQGKLAITGSPWLDVYVNEPDVVPCNKESSRYVKVGTLTAGQSKSFTMTGFFSRVGTTKMFRAVVDTTCSIVEGNESNNQLTYAW
jgi:hypothetical protein